MHFDCIILEGHRGQVEQNKAYAEKKSKLTWPNGKHNSMPSMAVDVGPYPLKWDDIKNFHYFSGFVMGIAVRLKAEEKITHGIRWGGAWSGLDKLNNDKVLADYVHFEIVP